MASDAKPAAHVHTRRVIKMLAALVSIVMAATALFAFIAPVPEQDWYGTVVAPSAATVGVARAAGGALHVAYGGHGLFYATNASGTWVSRLLDNVSACCASVAVDGAGRVHVAYLADDGIHPPSIRYGVWDGSQFGETTLFHASWVGSISLALDLKGHAHLAFVADVNDYLHPLLMYGDDLTGPLTPAALTTVANFSTPNALLSSSLAVDREGHVYIAAALGGSSFVTGIYIHASTDWHFEEVDTSSDRMDWVSLAADSTNHLHLAYSHLGAVGAAWTLRYATNVTGSWSMQDVAAGSPSGYTTLSLDASDRPHLLFRAAGNTLEYATLVSGGWRTSSVCDINFVDAYGYAISPGPEGVVDVLTITDYPRLTLNHFTNVVPPPTLSFLAGRSAPLLAWEALGAAAVFATILLAARIRGSIGWRREKRRLAEAKTAELMRLR